MTAVAGYRLWNCITVLIVLAMLIIMIPPRSSLAGNKLPYKKVTVRQGDTLAALCRRHLGEYNATLSGVVLKLNPNITHRNHILPGEILIPVTADCGETRQYREIVIQKGDTLAGISRRYLGAYSQPVLDSILQLNAEIRNPNRIAAGDTLRIPCPLKERLEPLEAVEPKEALPDKPVIKALAAPGKETERITEEKHSGDVETAEPSDELYTEYPPPMPGSIHTLTWTGDNSALIEGRLEASATCRFFVYVPGDLEYEQKELTVLPDNTFQVRALIGRKGRDYNKKFILKLALFDGENRVGEIRRSLVRTRHEKGEMISLAAAADSGVQSPHPRGWDGLKTWVAVQGVDAMQVDNQAFRVTGGRVVPNYRYLSYNPDERYLSWYGRVTLYGSACLAKALLIGGKTADAEAVLRVWAAQVDRNGKVPRSANVIGDNYISPDVRTGETAHFLGALALAKAITRSTEWDRPIGRIVYGYLKPLQDQKTGLVSGGYNGRGSNGYTRANGYEKILWFSAEHNFDLFQSLTLLTQLDMEVSAPSFPPPGNMGADLSETCTQMASEIARGIDRHMWDSEAGTFNRGWRKDTGPDRSRALDCASWGALYLLKRAKIAEKANEPEQRSEFLKKARRCLAFAENQFAARWGYWTTEGRQGIVEGFRPYDGLIDDLRWEDGPLSGEMIDWPAQNTMVWSEGSLGVAKAWEEYARACGNNEAEKRSLQIYEQMKLLQGLSDRGGVLYSTKQIKGHFTVGEELASLAWLGYLSLVHESTPWEKHGELLEWVPW